MVHYEMFIEVMNDGLEYDVVQFGPDEYSAYWGEEIITCADGLRTWEHAMEDIAIYQPTVIKINMR